MIRWFSASIRARACSTVAPARKPANHLMVLAVPRFLRTGLCVERQRREDADVRIEEREALRQNADDEIRLVVQPQVSADDGVDSAGLLGGKGMAEERYVVVSDLACRPP